MEQALLTLPEHLNSSPVFSGVRVARALVFCVVFCRSLFILLSFFFWSLYCLSFDLRLQITLFGIFNLFLDSPLSCPFIPISFLTNLRMFAFIYFNSCLLFNCSDFMASTKENAAYVVILMTQYHVKTRLMGNMRMGLLCADTGSTRNL